MSMITYEELIQREACLKASLDNRKILEDQLQQSFLIILEGFEGIEQTEKALSYFSNQFLITFITTILNDNRCEAENYVIHREMLYRVLDLIIPVLMKDKNEFIHHVKLLLNPSSSFFEKESDFFLNSDKYNFPEEIINEDLYAKVKEGDRIEAIIEKEGIRQWETCTVKSKSETEIIVASEIRKDESTIFKENSKGKIALEKAFVEDSSWIQNLKEDDILDAYYHPKWYKSTVKSIEKYFKRKRLEIGLYAPTNESETFLFKDWKGRTVSGLRPHIYLPTFDIDTNLLKKNGSITKEGIYVDKIFENDSLNLDDSEDILLYNPQSLPYKRFIIREKKNKSESFIELVRKFFELKGIDYLIGKIKAFSPNEIEFFLDSLEILCNLYFLYHRLYVKEINEAIYGKVIDFIMQCSEANTFKSISKLEKIINLLEFLLSRIYTFYTRKKLIMQLKLNVFNIFLNSKNIEKKLQVISAMQSIFKGYDKPTFSYSMSDYFLDVSKIMRAQFTEFLINNNFIEKVFGPSGHWQLIEKSDEIVISILDKKFNDKNNINSIPNLCLFEKIWEGRKVDAQTKNEIFKLIMRISSSLTSEQIEFIIGKLIEEKKISQIELDLLMSLFKTPNVLSNEIMEKLFYLALNLEEDGKVNIDTIIEKFIHLIYKNRSEEIIKLMDRSLHLDPPPVNIFKMMRKYLERARNDNIHIERQTLNLNFIKSLKPLELLINYLKNLKNLKNLQNLQSFEPSKVDPDYIVLSTKLFLELEPLQMEYTRNEIEVIDLFKDLWTIYMDSSNIRNEFQQFFKIVRWNLEYLPRMTKEKFKLFNEIFLKLDTLTSEKTKSVTINDFKTIKFLFLLHHYFKQLNQVDNIYLVDTDNFKITLTSPLNLQIFWRIFEFATDEKVVDQAEKYIIKIYKDAQDLDLLIEKGLMFEIKKALDLIIYENEINSNIQQNKNKIVRIIKLMENLMEVSEVTSAEAKSHNSISGGYSVIVEFTHSNYYNYVQRKIQMKSNNTVWEMKCEIANQLNRKPYELEYRISEVYGKHTELKNHLLISQISQQKEISISVEKNSNLPIKKEPALDQNKNLTIKASNAFESIFRKYQQVQGVWNRFSASQYLNLVMKAYITENHEEVTKLLNEGKEFEGRITEKEFKEHYRIMLLKNETEVYEHLSKSSFRQDLSKNDDPLPPLPKPKIQLFPRFFLSNIPEYFNIFWCLLEKGNSDIKTIMWNFILNLSTCKNLEFAIREIYLRSDPDRILTKLFSGIYNSCYCLYIIEVIFSQERTNANVEWIVNFYNKGGLSFLAKSVLDFINNKSVETLEYVFRFIKIVNVFLVAIIKNKESTLTFSKDLQKEYTYLSIPSRTIPFQISSLNDICSFQISYYINFDNLVSKFPSTLLMDIFYQMILLLLDLSREKESKDITKNVKEIMEICKTFYALFPLGLDKFLSFAISSLTQNYEIRKNFSDFCSFYLINTKEIIPILDNLLSFLENIKGNCDYTSELNSYFQIVFEQIFQNSSEAQIEGIMEKLFNLFFGIKKMPLSENQNDDPRFISIAQIIKIMINKFDIQKDIENKLLDHLLSKCLFPEIISDSPCQGSSTREEAFNLLLALSQKEHYFIEQIIYVK